MPNFLRPENLTNLFTLILIGLLLSSCQIRHQDSELSPWPLDQEVRTKLKECSVRARLSGKVQDESFRSDIVWNYERSKPRLIGILRGAFGESLAKFEIYKSKGTYSDARGSRPLNQEPFFKELLENDWMDVMDFFVGIIRQSIGPKVRQNFQHQPVQFKDNEKAIDCVFESGAVRPQSCIVTTRDIKVKIDFTSVECRESLS